MKNYKFYLALKYLKSRRKEKFISLISIISIIGIIIGVMTLIIVISVMDGFDKSLRDKIISINSHLIVLKYGGDVQNYKNVEKKIKNIKGITDIEPFIYKQAMVSYQGVVSGVIVRGILANSKILKKVIKEGRLNNKINSIVIGNELAKNLGVYIGDKVNIISPFGRLTPMGMIPKMKRFVITGIFQSGMYDYDSSLVFISIKDAQQFFNMKHRVTGIEIFLKNIYDVKKIERLVKLKLGNLYWTRDWMEMNKNLFSAMKLERVTMFIILTLIILVAAFNIASTLIMIILEKNRDIAILKSMGAKRKDIMDIFIIKGLIIGITGSIIGTILGCFICFLLKKYQFIKLPSDVYYITKLPVEVNFYYVVIIFMSSILLSFLATLYPAIQASKLKPAEILRYE